MSEDTMTVEGNTGSGNSGIHWGGDGGGNNSGKDKQTPSGVNLSKTPEAQGAVAFGAPLMIGMFDGMWGFTLFSNTTLHEAFLNGLSLPTQQATAVHTRIADVVAEDGKQHLAIVRDTDRLGSVPVVEAKATQRAGVYTASVVPGKPDVHIKIAAGTAPAVSQQKSVQKEQGGSRFPGFTAGQQSHDAIVRFPGNKISPIYISITEVLPESEIRKQH